MKLNTQNPKITLNKAFLKQRPLRSEIELFKANLKNLLEKVKLKESEENKKNHVRDFLLDTYYKDKNEINTKDRKDLVIHLGKSAQDKVGVIIEAKSPDNKAEMLRQDKLNTKAFHELVLYYFDERQAKDNAELKNLIVTNSHEWFIFDANEFDKKIYRNTAIRNLYQTYKNDKKDNLFFYEEIRKLLDNSEDEINCTYFNLKNYETFLYNDDLADDKNLIELFKILSRHHLLKEPFTADSNSLNKQFYDELLHIIGLEEIKDKSKTIIQRKDESRRTQGSLLENAITILRTKDSLRRVKDIANYGETTEERYFNVALELCITWINRILFLKLLESQLVIYHKGNADYKFLNIFTIPDFDELFTLFHQVLAKTIDDRETQIKEKYKRVPYLNSSLFEISDLEDATISIESLKDTTSLPFINSTILRELKNSGKSLTTLEYLFRFLDAYDFASEGAEDVQADNRSLINASVLGKVFEKINGYKDGSIFTPAFITMYMCRQAIRLAVVQKFKDKFAIDIDTFDDLKNFVGNTFKTEKILEYNALINEIHLCDPAVGSGHFLVSSLNEIIAIKSELGLFADEKGIRFSDYQIVIENDELIITDEKGDIFEYQINDDGKPTAKAQKLQKALFHEKQTLIENCLFGVDINPNSVKICRLRLWIELLKNAYYKESSGYAELETLPNIDINIKCGNSLLSRFALNEDLKKVLKQIKYSVEDYRNFVLGYKETRDREAKREFEAKIKQIKDDFKTQLFHFSPERVKLADLENQLKASESIQYLFGEVEEEKAKRLEDEEKLRAKIEKAKNAIKQIEENAIYKNAFEWRFEFPEVLDNEGNFLGFDIIIGNPPYIEARSSVIDEKLKDEVLKNIGERREAKDAKLITRGSDILIYFFEVGLYIIKDSGYFSFITQNAWLDTDYGFKFQTFLRNNTQVLGVFDNEIKYFDESANINTIITLFKGKKAIEENKISFAKFNVGFENAPIDLKEIASSQNKGQINNFGQSDSILNQMKWGIILNSDNLIIDLHKRLLEKESKTQLKLKIGQGLNLTKDFVVSQELTDKLGISQTNLIPFFTNDDGALFKIDNTKNFLIEAERLSKKEKEILAIEGIKSIELNKSARLTPNLILPRGVGRFFCAYNSCNAFSSSFVEIYLQELEDHNDAYLYFWTFLNSTIGWLIREISGRKNLGGGMLKAEATDLKNYPIYFDLKSNLPEIERLYRKLSERQAESILTELETEEHKQIDSIIFDKLEFNNDERIRLRKKFIELVSFRINKSKSKI